VLKDIALAFLLSCLELTARSQVRRIKGGRVPVAIVRGVADFPNVEGERGRGNKYCSTEFYFIEVNF